MATNLRERLDLVSLVVGCALHWLVGRLWTRRDPFLWVFGARSGTDFADNAKYCYLHVAANHPEVRPVWLSTNREIVAELDERGYEAYHSFSLRGIWLSLRAGVVLFTHGLRDVNLPCSGGARTILLWHGTPLKHVSWDSHFPDASPPVQWAHRYAHDVIDLLTIAGEAVRDPLASGLHIDTERMAVTGYPRNDALVGSISGAEIGLDAGAFERVQRLASEHTLLFYLPTFRDDGPSACEHLDIDALDRVLEATDAYLCVKTHPHERFELTGNSERVIQLPERTDIYPLLAHADVLVTDYSSILFDFLTLDRPMVFYPYDLDQYRTERGFYFEYETVTPGPVARTSAELVECIEQVLDTDEYAVERARLRERFCPQRENRSETVYEAVRGLL